jgi:hypothetical protein
MAPSPSVALLWQPPSNPVPLESISSGGITRNPVDFPAEMDRTHPTRSRLRSDHPARRSAAIPVKQTIREPLLAKVVRRVPEEAHLFCEAMDNFL